MWAKITDKQVEQMDKFGTFNALGVAALLQSLSHQHVSGNVEAGASGVTVTEQLTVAPDRMKFTSAKFLIQVVQTGSGNTPTLNLKVGSTVVATVADVALGKAVGDVVELALSSTAADLIVAKGGVVKAEIVNPAGTITVALKGKFIFDWNSIAD